MDTFEKHISNLVEQQFPDMYRNEGPVFVAFVKKYYEWLETSGGALYHARHMAEYKDVDETTDEFLLFFKEKYLKNIQLDTNTNTRQLIKHSLDLYRSKGTERAIELLFRLVFGVGADVYYPADDLFRLSDGTWTVPRYLEVSLNPENYKLVNKQIIGLTSGAKAFAEKVVRRKVKGRIVEIIYISAIKGNFQTGERINSTDGAIPFKKIPVVIGSLNDVVVSASGTGDGFVVGDVVDVASLSGAGGKARVKTISDITGLVEFELIDGGYGFTANSEVIVSEKVVTVCNVRISNASQAFYYEDFESLIQRKANVNYVSANGTYVVGDELYTLYANASTKGTGRIMAATSINSTAGELFISVYSGDMNDNTIYSNTNPVVANLAVSNGYFDRTTTANIVGILSTLELNLDTLSGSFTAGEELYQNVAGSEIAGGLYLRTTDTSGPLLTISVSNASGRFHGNTVVYGRTSNATANVRSLNLDVGVFDIDTAFTSNTYNLVYSSQSNTSGFINAISEGSGASIEVADDLLNSEEVELNNDFLRDYANVALNAVAYGFPTFPSGNASTLMATCLDIQVYEIGQIGRLVNVNRGSGYNKPVVARVFEPLTYQYLRPDDVELQLSSTDGQFQVGELVTQAATNARGMVQAGSNSTVLLLTQLRLFANNEFIPTINSTTIIAGESSTSHANVATVTEPETGTNYIGFDALIGAQVQSGNGSITELQVLDSGYGYSNNESVTLTLGDKTAVGSAHLRTHGSASGYYRDRGGFISDEKKLFDGIYYQEYSYEVQSSVALAKYQDMLKQVVHVAGTKFFGSLHHNITANAQVNILSADITIS